MSKTSTPTSPFRLRRLSAGLAALLIVIFGLALLPPQASLADGGGWPTATPTATRKPTKTPTLQPTVSAPLLIIEESATPQVNAILPGQQAGQPVIGFQAPVATPAPQPFSIWTCWPFAVVGFVVVILALLGISRGIKRRARESGE